MAMSVGVGVWQLMVFFNSRTGGGGDASSRSGSTVGDDLSAALVVQIVVPVSEVISGILISSESQVAERGVVLTVRLHVGGHLRRHGGGSV